MDVGSRPLSDMGSRTLWMWEVGLSRKWEVWRSLDVGSWPVQMWEDVCVGVPILLLLLLQLLLLLLLLPTLSITER